MNGTLRFIASHPLTRSHQAAAWYRFLAWQLRSRISAGPHQIPWIGDLQLSVKQGDRGLTGNIYFGLHEFWEMAFVLHFLRSEDLFVDAGANLGSYTLLASGVAGAQSISIEPLPDTYARLQDNIQLNSLTDKVNACQVGLADKTGSLQFSDLQDSAINRVVSSGGTTLPVTTIDELVGDQAPSLIKLDVEGYESRVLDGATKLLETNCVVLMETLVEREALTARLASKGYQPYIYDPWQRVLLPAEGDSNNTLFISDLAACLERVSKARPFSVLGFDV